MDYEIMNAERRLHLGALSPAALAAAGTTKGITGSGGEHSAVLHKTQHHPAA